MEDAFFVINFFTKSPSKFLNQNVIRFDFVKWDKRDDTGGGEKSGKEPRTLLPGSESVTEFYIMRVMQFRFAFD